MTATHKEPLQPVGIIAALPFEARAFGMRVPRDGIADLGGNAWLAVCGVGAEQARRVATQLLKHPIAGLVSWGTAGALSARIAAGDCLLPRMVLAADAAYEVDAGWHRRIAARLAGHLAVNDEPMYSNGTVLAAPSEKLAAHEQTGAVAVDVESGAIADVAAGAGIPFICIRAVLDTVDTMLPEVATEGLDDDGYPVAARVASSLLSHPGQLRALPRLLRQMRAARQTLATVARDTGPRLLGP